MNAQEVMSPQKKRIHWMDNLRSITILLVVLYHVGGVYESAGFMSPLGCGARSGSWMIRQR